MKKIIKTILPIIILASCSVSIPENNKIAPSTDISNTQNTIQNFSVELLIEQQKTSGELICIGSKGVQSVSLDSFDLPIEKLVKKELKIEIPSINKAKHQLSVSLYSLKEAFEVPLIIPDLKIDKVFVLIRFIVDETTKVAKKIEYGYDLDRNGIIDNNLNQFQSIDKNKFLQISSSGERTEIDIKNNLDGESTLPDNESLPPGIVPSNNEIAKSNIQEQPVIIEPPKPQSNDLSLYPLPPSSSNAGQNLPPSFPEFPNPQKSSIPE